MLRLIAFVLTVLVAIASRLDAQPPGCRCGANCPCIGFRRTVQAAPPSTPLIVSRPIVVQPTVSWPSQPVYVSQPQPIFRQANPVVIRNNCPGGVCPVAR